MKGVSIAILSDPLPDTVAFADKLLYPSISSQPLTPFPQELLLLHKSLIHNWYFNLNERNKPIIERPIADT